jgi:hypothetical protein
MSTVTERLTYGIEGDWIPAYESVHACQLYRLCRVKGNINEVGRHNDINRSFSF